MTSNFNFYHSSLFLEREKKKDIFFQPYEPLGNFIAIVY